MQQKRIQCNAIEYNIKQCNTIEKNTIQRNAMQGNRIQYIAMQSNPMQYNTIIYSSTNDDTKEKRKLYNI